MMITMEMITIMRVMVWMMMMMMLIKNNNDDDDNDDDNNVDDDDDNDDDDNDGNNNNIIAVVVVAATIVVVVVVVAAAAAAVVVVVVVVTALALSPSLSLSFYLIFHGWALKNHYQQKVALTCYWEYNFSSLSPLPPHPISLSRLPTMPKKMSPRQPLRSRRVSGMSVSAISRQEMENLHWLRQHQALLVTALLAAPVSVSLP